MEFFARKRVNFSRDIDTLKMQVGELARDLERLAGLVPDTVPESQQGIDGDQTFEIRAGHASPRGTDASQRLTPPGFAPGSLVVEGSTGAQGSQATTNLCYVDVPNAWVNMGVFLRGWIEMFTQDEDLVNDGDAYVESILWAMHRDQDGTVHNGAVTEGDFAESSATGGFPWYYLVIHSPNTPSPKYDRFTLQVVGASVLPSLFYDLHYCVSFKAKASAVKLPLP